MQLFNTCWIHNLLEFIIQVFVLNPLLMNWLLYNDLIYNLLFKYVIILFN